ncbi:MAG: PaaI family thioesterase [Phycisphaerae bacterium]|jgi:uncharacterized protein (TIGR00369 family)|nr:PaaI family thioesterase [Phycisphaerae bacterium]MCZ2400510.1 PaaI family thioesterase [Phycisphaerae bacterium]
MIDPGRVEAILAKCRLAPCIDSLGLRLVECDEGSCKLTARHDPRFNGLLPGFHGGMLANVADCVAWFAIVTLTGPDEPLVTTDMQLRYLGACVGDATATARVIKLGRTLCPVAIDIFDASGRHVVCGQVTYIRIAALGAPAP